MRKFLLIFVPFLLAFFVFSLSIFLLANNGQKGALQVTSSPDSKVYLDDKPIGQTPLCKAPICTPQGYVKTGDHILKLVPLTGGAEPFVQKITIYSNVLTVVDRKFDKTGFSSASIVSLTPIDDKKVAQINVITFPQSSDIFIDNNLSGQTPIILKKVTDSDHELKVSKQGYKDKIVRIRTVLGYKLNALIFLGLNPQLASSSAIISTQSALSVTQKVLILTTPTGFLRVRSSPSISASEIGQVKPGETYNLLSEKEGWYEIKFNTKINGWISSQYAKKQG